MDIDAVQVMLKLTEKDYILNDKVLYMRNLYYMADAFNEYILKSDSELFCKYIYDLQNKNISYIKDFTIETERQGIPVFGSFMPITSRDNKKKIKLTLQNAETMTNRIVEIALTI